jgi:hypothetical protein
MPQPVRRRKLAALILSFALLMAQEVWAREHEAKPGSPRVASAATLALSDYMGRVWKSVRRFLVPEGCTIDPNGHCIGGTQSGNGSGKGVSGSGDEACTIDPSGHPHCPPT